MARLGQWAGVAIAALGQWAGVERRYLGQWAGLSTAIEWLVAAQSAASDVDVGSWNGYTSVQVIGSAEISNTGKQFFRVSISAASGASFTFANMYVEHQGAGDAYDFAASPTQVTFDGGSAGATVGAGTTKVSDLIEFTIDSGKALVVAFYCGSVKDDMACRNVEANWSSYWKLGSDAITVDKTGYTGSARDADGILLVESGE